MATEGFEVEEWDADFLDQLVQAEESALSTSATQQQQQQLLLHHHHPLPPCQPPPRPAPPYWNTTYSPPRELSQRVHDSPAVVGNRHSSLTSASVSNAPEGAKEREIDSLKTELGRVSEQLKILEEECIELKKERDNNGEQLINISAQIGAKEAEEEECIELKKERDKKEKQLKCISARVEAKGAEDCHANSMSSRFSVGTHDDHGVLPECQKNNSSNEFFGFRVNQRISASKAVGVQTEDAGESDSSSFKNDVGYHHHKKLLGVWDLLNGHKLGKDLALTLFGTCEADFKVLFGYLNLSLSLPSNTMMEHSMRKSNVPLGDHWQSIHSIDAAKISHLYLMLTKISNEMVRLDDLLEALFDCCSLKNGVIVYRSLRVLHVVLKHATHMRKKIGRRENIMVASPLSEHIVADICEEQSYNQGSFLYPRAKKMLNQWDSQQGAKWFNAKRNSSIPSPTNFDWFSLFNLMNQIAMTNLEEHVRLEAVSVMNMILISSTAYSEREKFGTEPVFQSISQLLRKEAGFCVRKQAVNLLYQLLNCPKVTAAFCFGCTENGEAAVSAEIGAKTYPSFQEFNAIMDGLVECVTCTGNSTKELKLRRSVINVLAFIASLGKAGLGIMLNHRLPKRINILASILESLTTDVNLEPLDSAQSVEIFRERTLLIREALILLNRLVSHPQFSTSVLQVLTSGREVTSLTIDVAKRLSHKGKFLWQDDSITKQIRESEIVELARVFKRRVFTFLGDGIS